MELVELPGMTPEGRAELAAGEAHPFGINDLQWRESDRYLALRDDGKLVAAAGLVVATVEADRAFEVVGVGGVIVARPRRGEGLMRRVMDAAMARAEQLGPSFAMLFCSFANSRRYARFGFREITSACTAEQPGGRIVTMGEVAMWRPLRADATWPDGPIRVRGLPF